MFQRPWARHMLRRNPRSTVLGLVALAAKNPTVQTAEPFKRGLTTDNGWGGTGGPAVLRVCCQALHGPRLLLILLLAPVAASLRSVVPWRPWWHRTAFCTVPGRLLRRPCLAPDIRSVEPMNIPPILLPKYPHVSRETAPPACRDNAYTLQTARASIANTLMRRVRIHPRSSSRRPGRRLSRATASGHRESLETCELGRRDLLSAAPCRSAPARWVSSGERPPARVI